MKNNRIQILALFILQLFWFHAAYSQAPDRPKIDEELTKQQKIYQTQDAKMAEVYKVDRSLSDYALALPSDFGRALASLGPNDRWLDIGAGKAQAILDYYAPSYDLSRPEGRERRGKKARAVAMSIEDRRTPLWQQSAASLGPGQIQYLFDRRLREYSLEELGRFQVITDVIGGFSYAENLSLFMEKVLGFLELNGNFYTLLQDVRSEAGTNAPFYPGSPFLTEITNASGSDVKVCSWLKSISCVEVACELKADWKPPIETFRVHKVCNDVRVPALTTIHYQAVLLRKGDSS